jgi:hypothetical protein
MKTRGTGTGIWLLSGVGAVLAMALVLMLFHAPSADVSSLPQSTPRPVPAVGLARLGDDGEDALLKDEATMRDPTPLFRPTRWNAGEDVLPKDFRREFGTSFQGYPPKLTYTGSALKVNLPPPVIVPLRPADAFATDKPARPFFGFGQTDQQPPTVVPRRAFMQVTSAANGQAVIAEPLQDARPPADVVWQPMEFLVAVDRTGVVRPPVLTESSRVAAVDGYFVEYLVSGLHIGERLAPGFYRVAIGP